MLLRRVERHLRTFDISATRFGCEAAGDRGFVFGLRKGREPGAKMIARVDAYMRARIAEPRGGQPA